LSTSTIERNTVEQAMRTAGYGQYVGYAGDLTAHLRGGQVTAERVQSYARSRGLTISYQQAQTFCNTLLGSGTERVGADATTPANQLTEGFNREHAADVIRRAAREVNADPAQIEEVLREAGLVDETDTADEEAPAWARGIIDRLDRIENAARQRGIRI
jgi:hypothetical protein